MWGEVLMSVTRRDLLASGPAAVAAAAGAAVAAPVGYADDSRINGMFAVLSDALLIDSPETATSLALDKGSRANLKSQLSDVSWAHVSQDHVTCAARLEKLNAI